jgi:mRNA-degrading endonuclease RelE of RelBE toxin-antitoxin system
MTSRREGPARPKKSSAKPSYKVELSRTAEKSLPTNDEKEMKLIQELLSIIMRDPYNRQHSIKLHGEWEGHRRVKKGDWRVIYLPPSEGIVYVVYIRGRDEKTYKKK